MTHTLCRQASSVHIHSYLEITCIENSSRDTSAMVVNLNQDALAFQSAVLRIF